MRLNKYLASLGVASRRKVDKLIKERRVKINDHVAKLGDQVEPEKDQISVSGKEMVKREEQKVYIILNKPSGYTSTVAKIKGEKNVLELISHPEPIWSEAHGRRLDSGSRFRIKPRMTGVGYERLYPVGRLDKDSTGLILLTNNGELAQKLTHPKFHIPKTYEVLILGNVSDTQIEMMSKGITLEDGKTVPADVKVIRKSLPNHTLLQITLCQGKKRQIRRMAAALHLHILGLKRTSIGSIKLGNLKVGDYRQLTREELLALNSKS